MVEAEAASLGASLTLMGRDFDAYETAGRLTVALDDRLLDLPLPNLPGEHQYDNAALAAVALLKLGDPRIDDTAIAGGVTSAEWPGRFQRLTAGPLGDIARRAGADLWLDGGHNPHGARALAKGVRSDFGPRRATLDLHCRPAGPQGRRRLLRGSRGLEAAGYRRAVQFTERHGAEHPG